MSKPEWGQKRTCQACSARFYDLKKNPTTCPKCGKEFDPSAAVKKRRGRPPLAEKKKEEAAAVAEAEAKAKVKVAEIATETEGADTIPEVDIEADIGIDEADDELLAEEDDDLAEDDIASTVPLPKDKD